MLQFVKYGSQSKKADRMYCDRDKQANFHLEFIIREIGKKS